MQSIRIIETSFSTADAEDLDLKYADGELVLRFTDWREQSIQVKFEEVISFSLNSVTLLFEDERSDCSYEVLDSEWLELHRKAGEIELSEKYCHFRINFNDVGQLEILASSYAIET